VSAPGSAATPVAGPSATSPAVGYRLPSWGWRILASGLRLIPLMVLLVGLPIALITFLSAHGVASPIPVETIELFGIALTVLGTLRYLLKPTAGYGPLCVATSGVGLLYLYVIYLASSYRIAIGSTGFAISISYGDLILLLMIGPALALVAGVLTTYEDAAHPKERLPFDFPA
jgi:hypothetical protein